MAELGQPETRRDGPKVRRDPESDLFALSVSPTDAPLPTEKAPPVAARILAAPAPLPQGPRLLDFILLRELGEGGFAKVYLAHQITLERRVALKVSMHPSRDEGQILASLEHDHIVKVYSDFHDPGSGQNGLVLQYVAGTNLASVVERLFADGNRPAKGEDILAAVDTLAKDEVDFNPAALRDRELFEKGDYVATVCRLGARLAEALAYAHGHGVLHCDIKPANILLNRYGRPLLADFNVAVPKKGEAASIVRGGTLLYMAPEQLALFTGDYETERVDFRADLYSLGLVLLEAVVGRLPPLEREAMGGIDREKLLADKKDPDRWLAACRAKTPEVLWRALRRCVDPAPAARYLSGMELAAALHRAADLHEGQTRRRREGWFEAFVRCFPMWALAIFTLAPHLAGTAVNIAYNTAQIPLNEIQQERFWDLVFLYNGVIYPVCLGIALMVLWPLMRAAGRGAAWCNLETTQFDPLRKRSLSLGGWSVGLALLGWIPGGLFFPLALNLVAGPVGWHVFGHFLVSFTLSGLIAIVYSYLGVQFVVLRGFYPGLVHADQGAAAAQREYQKLVGRLGWFQVLAAFVPLAGAVLLVALAPAEFTLTFRLLVTGLIGMGLMGLGAAVWAAGYLRNVAQELTGAPKGELRPL